MRPHSRIVVAIAGATLLLLYPSAAAAAQKKAAPAPPPRPIQLEVDARDAPRHIYHSRLVIPATPGPLTLVYPKWVAGKHAPTGPIADLTGLHFRAGERTIEWQRDPVDLFAFHIVVPPGADTIEARLDYLAPSGSGALDTDRLAWIYWHRLLLVPQSARNDATVLVPSLRLPSDWRPGTSLAVASESTERTAFAPVSLDTLLDSPVLAGVYVKTIQLADAPVPHRIFLAADSEGALLAPPATVDGLKRLVAESLALFGAHHYRSYTFLYSLSDQMPPSGLEHHEQSDNMGLERTLLDEDLRRDAADILPHELIHSWNGKYRRPAGLLTANVSDPMRTELLWVYEGLAQYLGEVLAARSGLWTADEYGQAVAYGAARMDQQRGRDWRPLADTATGAPLRGARPGGASWRRGTDYYSEGALLWLEADILIRRESRGTKSLDDFLRSFFGGTSGPPLAVPYAVDDVLAALNQVLPYDWRGFWRARVEAVTPKAPLGGIEGAGFSLAYGDTRTPFQKGREAVDAYVDERFSIGLVLSPEGGGVSDVIPGSAADKAGLAPGDTLLAVNGRRYSTAKLREAIKDSRASHAIDLVVANGDFVGMRRIDYDGGARYPRLDPVAGQVDLLTEIIRPRANPTPGPVQ